MRRLACKEVACNEHKEMADANDYDAATAAGNKNNIIALVTEIFKKNGNPGY